MTLNSCASPASKATDRSTAGVSCANAAILREGSYRDRAMPAIEELWKMVEDPACAPDRRVAAATTLRGALDDDGRTRLRVAAEATAAPRVRIALTAAAEDDDDKLAQALDDVTADAGQRAGS